MNIKKKVLSAILSVTVSFSFIVTFMLSSVRAEAADVFTVCARIAYLEKLINMKAV